MARDRSEEERYLIALKDAVGIGKSVVSKCNRTKHLSGVNLWVTAMLAKSTITGEAVHALIRSGYLTETKLLLRSLYDALIDIVYIRNGPHRTDELVTLYLREVAVDRAERLEWYAARQDMSTRAFVSRNPELKCIVEAAKDVKRRSGSSRCNRRRGVQSYERWKEIPIGEKLKYAEGVERALRPFGYSVRSMGHAHAHHRPSGLREFMYKRKDGSAGVKVSGSPGDFMYSSTWVSFEATLLLLTMSDQLIDKFFLGSRLEGRVQRLIDRLRALGGLVAGRGTGTSRITFSI